MAGYYKYGTATMITNEGFKGGTTGVAEPICVNSKMGRAGVDNIQPSIQDRIYDVGGEMTAVTTAFHPSIAEPVQGKSSNKQLKIYEVKDGKVLINEKEYPIKLEDGFYHIRKLTVRECMRLQQVPEWYEFPVSNSQAYKMLGNGWSILVIKHLIDAIENEMKEEE